VIVADTNVWARAFLGDDPKQTPIARSALASARTKEGVFVPLIVIAELAWVLRGAKWDRERIIESLDHLLHTRGVTVEALHLVRQALDATIESRRGGFVDHLIAQVGFAHGCHKVITFDALFGKSAKASRL
jgi:predicted nucleic-acid-binding protein